MLFSSDLFKTDNDVKVLEGCKHQNVLNTKTVYLKHLVESLHVLNGVKYLTGTAGFILLKNGITDTDPGHFLSLSSVTDLSVNSRIWWSTFTADQHPDLGLDLSSAFDCCDEVKMAQKRNQSDREKSLDLSGSIEGCRTFPCGLHELYQCMRPGQRPVLVINTMLAGLVEELKKMESTGDWTWRSHSISALWTNVKAPGRRSLSQVSFSSSVSYISSSCLCLCLLLRKLLWGFLRVCHQLLL